MICSAIISPSSSRADSSALVVWPTAISETLRDKTFACFPTSSLNTASHESLAAAVLVGMMVTGLVLSHNHQNNALVAGKTATATIAPTATATPLSAGSIVYTRTSAKGTNLPSSVAWSPDGKRLATLAIHLQSLKAQLLIWDATTGGQLLTASLAENLGDIFWSPTGSIWHWPAYKQ